MSKVENNGDSHPIVGAEISEAFSTLLEHRAYLRAASAAASGQFLANDSMGVVAKNDKVAQQWLDVCQSCLDMSLVYVVLWISFGSLDLSIAPGINLNVHNNLRDPLSSWKRYNRIMGMPCGGLFCRNDFATHEDERFNFRNLQNFHNHLRRTLESLWDRVVFSHIDDDGVCRRPPIDIDILHKLYHKIESLLWKIHGLRDHEWLQSHKHVLVYLQR